MTEFITPSQIRALGKGAILSFGRATAVKTEVSKINNLYSTTDVNVSTEVLNIWVEENFCGLAMYASRETLRI